MSRARDPIFWTASGLFVLALVLAAVAGEAWLLLMAGAYLLRPTLYSAGLFRRLVDERQMLIQARASSAGFAAMVLGTVVVILVLMRRDDHTWEMLVAVLMVALAARALASLLLTGDVAAIGPRILISVGAFLALFGVLEGVESPGSFVAHIVPGLAIAGLGFLATRAPRLVGWLVLAAAVAALAGIVSSATSDRPGAWGTAVALALMGVPAAIAAIALLRTPRAGSEPRATAGPGPGTMVLLAGLAAAPAAAGPRVAQAQAALTDPRFECHAWNRGSGGHMCRLVRDDTVFGRTMPGGAFLHFDSAGVYTFFFLKKTARFADFDLAGSGSGVSHDVYPDGAPRGLWFQRSQEVQGVPCRGGNVFIGEVFRVSSRVRFHATGALLGCTLSRDATVAGRALRRGTRIELSVDGRLVAPPG
jgi:hypothetical protein